MPLSPEHIGHIYSAASDEAHGLGYYPSGGAAAHGGTAQQPLDTDHGLDSAVGGEDARGLEFVSIVFAARRARTRGAVPRGKGTGICRAGGPRVAHLAGAIDSPGRRSPGTSGGNGRGEISARARATAGACRIRHRVPGPAVWTRFLAEYVPMLDAGNWVNVGGLVYLENERADGAPALPPHWELLKSKSAGEVGYHLARVSSREP